MNLSDGLSSFPGRTLPFGAMRKFDAASAQEG